MVQRGGQDAEDSTQLKLLLSIWALKNRADSPFFWMKLETRVGNQQKFHCDRWHFPVGWYAEVNRAPARGWVIRWQQASQSLSGRGKFWHLDTTDVLMILSRWGGFWQQKCGHRKKSNQRWLAGVWLSNADVGNTDPGHTLFPTAATVGFQSGCCSVFSRGPSRNGTCNPATLELRTRCWVAKFG